MWNTHPEAAAWPPDKLTELHFTIAGTLRPGLRAVIEDHLAFDAPVVIEGDYVLPDLAAAYGGAVRAVVVHEADRPQLTANFAAREPGPRQDQRAAQSVRIGAELARRAQNAGQAVITARPWADAIDRADRALRAL